MDTDGSLKIDWNEWREYHFLNPSGHSMHDIIQFWRHSSVSCRVYTVGGDLFPCLHLKESP